MSKLRVDQLTPTDDSKTVNVSDINNAQKITSGVGNANRTVGQITSDGVNLANYTGTDPTGSTASDAAFTAAISDANGRRITVNPGTYLLSAVIDASGSHFFFNGNVTTTGVGYLQKAIIERINPASGAVSVASEGVRNTDGSPHYGANFAFGSNAGNVTGLQIGGGNPVNGTDGSILFQDGYAGWTTIQPSKFPSPIEFAVQPATRAGRCTTVSGSNQVNIISGAAITAAEVGKTVWLKDSGYTVATVGTNSFTVTNLNGSAVTFGAATTQTYVCCYIQGKGKCNISGTTITRLSGDPFVPLNNVATTFTVNGVTTTQAGYTDSWHATLTSAAGTANNVDYIWWGSVDNLASALRVHRVSGAGFEENVSLIAYAKGYYHLHAASGSTDQYPLYIGSGYDSDGTARRPITIDGVQGFTYIGGAYGRAALTVGYRQFSQGDANGFRVDGATSGNAPALTAVGVDTNINVIIAAKGTGFIQSNSDFRANAAIYPNIDGSYSLGTSGLKWSAVYATNGAIQTSDEREKDIFEMSAAEISAASEVAKSVLAYKWKNSATTDGVGDRRFGVSVQKVMGIMEKHGLNWEDYSMFSYDEKTDRYGMNYSELLSFAMAGIASKL